LEDSTEGRNRGDSEAADVTQEQASKIYVAVLVETGKQGEAPISICIHADEKDIFPVGF
jgi:hypothetical protein